MGSNRGPGSEGLTPESKLPLPADNVINIADARPAAAAAPAPPQTISRATVWLHRISLVIFVIFCIELGMLLTVLPWTRVWTDNGLLADHLTLKTILASYFMRGVVTGCGLIDIWIGIWEAVHYQENLPKS